MMAQEGVQEARTDISSGLKYHVSVRAVLCRALVYWPLGLLCALRHDRDRILCFPSPGGRGGVFTRSV